MKNQNNNFNECILSYKYPCQDYLSSLEWKRKEVENKLYNVTVEEFDMIETWNKMLESLNNTISKVKKRLFYYNVMDRIYAGEEVARNMCDEQTYQICYCMLQKMDKESEEIYLYYARTNTIICKNPKLEHYIANE